jgi:hypothetical protein
MELQGLAPVDERQRPGVVRQGDALHHQGWRINGEIAPVTRFPFARGSPDSGDAVVRQNAALQFGSNEDAEDSQGSDVTACARRRPSAVKKPS